MRRLADEPTSSLDATSTELVWEALVAAAQLATLVVATHDPEVTAVADRVIALRNGHVASVETEAPGRHRARRAGA